MSQPWLRVLHRSGRSISLGQRMLSTTQQPIIAQTKDADQVSRAITSLLSQERPWHLSPDNRGIQRAYVFKTFSATWDFMSDVAGECKRARHHPEWSNRYTKTVIRWTTHDADALTGKDVSMAEFCDDAALRHGEVAVEQIEGDIAPRLD